MLKPAIALGVLLLVVLVLAGCGGDNDESAATTSIDTTTTATTTEVMTETGSDDASSVCSRAADNVEDYDILAPGASRGEYLTLLHKLQRDCPEETRKRGLTADFLPKCKRLDQENCTMYEG